MPRRGPRFQLRAISIACTDKEKSAKFYSDVLGASVVPTDNGIGRFFQLGGIEFRLFPNAGEPSNSEFPTQSMFIPWLEVSDLESAAKWFQQHDVQIVDEANGESMMIADPDGLVIEIWQAED